MVDTIDKSVDLKEFTSNRLDDKDIIDQIYRKF